MMQVAGIVEELNSGRFAKLPKEEQLTALEIIRKSTEESYADFGPTYTLSYRAYFPDIAETIAPVIEQTRKLVARKKLEVLDVGSGPGEDLMYLQSLENIQAVGLEPSDFFIQECRKLVEEGVLQEESIFQGYAESMPFEDNRFHLVYARNSLLHVPYVEGSALGAASFFSEVKRVLKKGGVFYLHLREGDVGYVQRSTRRFFQLYNKEMLEKLAKQNGFKIHSFKRMELEQFPTENWRKWIQIELVA